MNQRPVGNTIAMVWYFLETVWWAVLAALFFGSTADALRVPFLAGAARQFLDLTVPLGLFSAALAGGYLAASLGLYNYRDWARTLAPVVVGVDLLSVFVALIQVARTPTPVGLTLSLPIFIAAVLIQGAVLYLLFTSTSAGPQGAPCLRCGQFVIRPGMFDCPVCGHRVGEPYPPPPPPPPPRSDKTRIWQDSASIRAWVMVRSGPGAGHEVQLSEDAEIGRDSSCQVKLADDYISRQHARIKLENGQFYIYDLGSSSGTFVNDRRIRHRHLLYDGALIRLGQTTLEFKRTAAVTH